TSPGRNYISATAYDYAYQGQEKDTETGYLNFDLRQYDPRIGRWFNPDPMYQHHSPYLAMGNNPISSIDPTGGTDYYVDGYLVSGLEADATMNGGNVDVSTGGLAIGTTIGYSYGDKNYYGSHGAENADAARKEAYKQFFKTMNWNLKGGTYSTSGYFYSDHEGFDDKIGGQAWAGMDFDDVAGWYNLATGATMSNVRKAWQWDDERPSSAWGYCYTQEECETGALIVGGAAVGVLAAPIVASYAALGAAWAGEQALTGAAYLTFKAQVLTGTVSGAGAGGILLGRNMPEVMKIASQSGLGYLKMPGFIANSNNFRAMATYNGLWLNYHLQSGTQVNMLLNAAKNSYAPSGFMKLEFIILRGFYGK
ncbi:MAG TPA: RHS repeat-associated core domain-containing protein, partial [Flavobacterium sp.]